MPRLHWSPIEPSWIVSLGLVVLAVLPHQIPRSGRRAINHPIGRILFAALSVAVWYLKPVLGTAMFILLVGIMLHPDMEPFALNKERAMSHTWFGEEALHETPRAIQERTENPVISFDEIVDHESTQWHSERVLNEQPHAIQEKAVGTVPEYDEGGASYGHR
jgi:hypothetical protein